MIRARVFARVSIALAMAIVLAAHVGSPNVYFHGNAGPYDMDVTVQPPSVVPGVAEVFVNVPDTTANRVVIRPVYWRAGSKGSPTGDEATRVASTKGLYQGRLWLMASGSYSVHVTVSGSAGSGTVIVPVAALATGQLALSPFLRVLLGVLATLLVAGIITAVHAASGESQLAPGASMTPEVRRRARRAALISVPLLAFVILGAANWWESEAARYRRTLYRPVPVHSVLSSAAGIPTLTVSVADSNWRNGGVTAIMPDHDKLAHQFIVHVDSPYVFAHLHPSMPDGNTFVSPLPPLPAGRYRIFTDIVHESGFERTLVDSVDLSAPIGDGGLPALTPDEAWSENEPIRVTANTDITFHERRLIMWWKGMSPIYVNTPGMVGIGLSEKGVRPPVIEPYLGMLGHAVVVRDDGKVFVHLHPSGTASMASQSAFRLRDAGDTTAKGRLQLEKAVMGAMPDSMRVSEIRFPYAFPDTGHYHVWVQVRFEGRVHTTGFSMVVRK